MQKVKLLIIIFIFPLLGIGCVCQDQKTPVDYVNAYIGKIMKLLRWQLMCNGCFIVIRTVKSGSKYF